METKLLVCLVLISGVSAVPLNIRDDFDPESDYKCSKQCNEKPVKFHYQPSETYVYEYKAEAETLMAGASEDKARLQIETHANIEVINTCEFALHLQNVKVFHSEPYSDSLKPAEQTQDFQRELMANTLRFSFEDGVIKDICHPSQEKIWVLNFKRGLLSAFQNSMDDLKTNIKIKEIDVTGECEAQYNTTKSWSWARTRKVTKTKDLLACSKRDGFKSLIPMVPYKVPSDIQSLPIMKSSHKCEQVFEKSGILSTASCIENHIFAPFSNEESGATTKVQQTMTFKVMKKGIETGLDYIETRGNLLFHHINGIDEVQNSREAAEQKLKEICEQTKIDVRPETPRLFSELVQIVKVLDSSDLRNLYKMIRNKRLCSQNDKAMKFLLDTLPVAGTPEVLELIPTIINNKEIPDWEIHHWLFSVSLIPEPTADMIPSLMKLLNGKYSDQALLPVSSLLHTMCEKNVDCDRTYQFKKIVKKMSQNIDSTCSSDEREKVMRTLRAIGNIGHGKDFLGSLEKCLNSRDAPLEYKVAAAEAYRRFPCQPDEENGPLFQTFENPNADPELRIISYLSIMRCPQDSVLRKVVAQLEKEEDVNVGTFVYTHLENVKKTSDPLSQDIAEAVRQLDLRKFNEGGLKTSRCFAHSALLNRLNIGYVADANLIWSKSSFVPRAARVNLTMALFGQSINVFEGGVRMDGLENLIEKYFGAEGYFPKDKASRNDFEAFVYARVFGNEFYFNQVKGTKNFDFEELKSQFGLDKILENLSQKYDYKYSHTEPLINTALIIPTAIGLPVNLTVNSSAMVNTEVKGKIDLSGVLARSKPIVVTTDGAASAALEVTGSMLVDAHFYKQGLRMRNTMHSSVNFKSSLSVKNKQIVDFEIESPQEKQELFDARSQFFIIQDNFEKEQDMIKENRMEQKSCTGDKFSKVTGLEVCEEISYPNASMKEDSPYFPFTGPARVSLVLNKKDTQRSYKVFAKWIRNSKKLEAQFQMDTPGSKEDRHISADVTIGFKKVKHLDIVFISPWNKLVLNGKAAKNDDMASLTGSVAVDDVDWYKLTSEVKMSKKSKHHQYLPFVEIEYHGDRTTLLTGSVVYNEEKDLTSDLMMTDMNKNSYTHSGQVIFHEQEKRLIFSVGQKDKRPFQIKIGSILKRSGRENQNIKVDPELLIQTPKGVIVSLSSNAEFQPKPLKVIGDVQLNAIRMRKPFILKVNVRKNKMTYPVYVKLSSSLMTGDVKGKVNVRKNSYSSTMKINYKTDSMKDRIDWSGKLLDRSKNAYSQYDYISNLKFKNMPDYNSKSTLVISHKKKSTADLTIYYGKKYDKKKMIQVTASASATLENIKQAKIEADLKAKMSEKNVDIVMSLDHEHSPKKLDSEIKLHIPLLLTDDINVVVNVQNKDKSLYVISGNGRVDIGKRSYDLKSDLVQKPNKKIQHTLIASSSEGDNHKVVTIYKAADSQHNIVTDIESSQLDTPLKLTVSTNVKTPLDFQVRGILTEDKMELYSVDAVTKLEKVAGKVNLELAYPQRRMKINANFNKLNDRIKAFSLVKWDLDSKKTPAPQIELTGFFTHKDEPGKMLLKSNVKISTPFQSLPKLNTVLNFDKSSSDLKTMARVEWGGIHKQIFSEVTAKLPISIESTKISFQAKTPFKNYKDIELEVDHEMNSQIKSIFKGKVNKDESELILNGKQEKDDESIKIQGDLTIRTPYQLAREVAVTVEGDVSNESAKTFIILDNDGERYSTDLTASSKPEAISSTLILAGPQRRTEASLTLKSQNGMQQIDASIESAKNGEKKITVDIKGAYHNVNLMNLNVNIKTPFDLRKVGLEFDHKVEERQLNSKLIGILNRARTGYDVKLQNKQKEMSADVLLLLSPAYEKDVSMMSKVEYEFYPVTASTQISWAPSSVIDLSGSYKAETTDDIQISLKLTTPFEDLENINVVASHVLGNSERVSHLNIDYDVRKEIDFEITTQNDDLKKLLRIKVDSPCPVFRHLDTEMKIDLNKDFTSKLALVLDLDLELKPEEKYKGSVTVNVGESGSFSNQITTFIERDGKDLLNVTVDNFRREDQFSIKVIAKGKLLEKLTGEIDELSNSEQPKHSGFLNIRVLNYILVQALRDTGIVHDNIQKDEDGNMIKQLIAEFKVQQDQMVEIDGSVSFDYGKKQHKDGFRILHVGDKWNNVDIDLLLTCTRQKNPLTGKFVLKLMDDTEISAKITDTFGAMYGVEFRHSVITDLSEMNGKIYLGKVEGYQNTFQFLMKDLQLGPKLEKIRSIKLRENSENLLDVTVDNSVSVNKTGLKIVAQGKLLEKLTGAIDELSKQKGNKLDEFFSIRAIHCVTVQALKDIGIVYDNIQKDEDGNMIKQLTTEFKIERGDQMVEIDGSVSYDYGKKQHMDAFRIRKTGDKWNNADIDFLLTCSRNKNSLTGKLTLKLMDVTKIVANGKIYLRNIESFQNNFIDNKIFIKLGKLTENLLDVEIDGNMRVHKTGIKVVTQGKLLEKLTGAIDELSKPKKLNPDYVLSMRLMSNVVLQGLRDLGIVRKDIQKDEDGNMIKQLTAEFKIEQRDQMVEVDGSLSFDYGVTQHKDGLTIQHTGDKWNNVDIDFLWTCSANENPLAGKLTLKLLDDTKSEINMELHYIGLGLESDGLILNFDGNQEKAYGKIQLLKGFGKALDVNIDFDLKSETRASLLVLEPKTMEYRFIRESNENELYLNWDRSDPDANLAVKGVFKDDSNSYETDKSMSLRLSHPRRSVGVEHSVFTSKVKVKSTGKIYWNNDKDSQVAYELQMNDQSNRRKNLLDGELKIQLPTRTVGVFGSTRDQINDYQVESTFSWDLDNDPSKKIGIKGKILKGPHTQADVSLILPLDSHIDSKLILNKGDTIFEGETQISFSDDSSKTLTLFSKVENRPQNSNFLYPEEKLNYSIQIRLSHPDSRIDVKMDSHLGLDNDRLTTSFGLDYLDFRRQTKNIDLFLEINKLKREINLIGASPYSNIDMSGAFISKNPLEIKTTTTIDDEEKVFAHLLVDPTLKKAQYQWRRFGRGLSLSAHYPNQTALQLDMNQQDKDQTQRYTSTVIRLSAPDMLQTSLHWKPGMLAEIRDMLFDNLKNGVDDYKEFVDKFAKDFKREVPEKFEAIGSSIYDDMKPFVNFLQQELATIEEDLEELQSNLGRNLDIYGVEIVPLTLLQEKLISFMNIIRGRITHCIERCSTQLLEKLEEIKNYSTSKTYKDLVHDISEMENKYFKKFYWYVSTLIHSITPEEIEQFVNDMEKKIIERAFDLQPLMNYLNEELREFITKRMSTRDFVNMIINTDKVAENHKAILKDIKEFVVNHPLTQDVTEVLEDSKVYQQAKWAYNYWDLEENLPEHLEDVVDLFIDVIEVEMREQLEFMLQRLRNSVTQFDPERGVLVAELPLPVSLDRIDQLPDVHQN